jgi:hypothetical protein
MATRIQVRRDTAANWTENDPTLAEGEIGFETDTGLFKIGRALPQTAPDGLNWNNLSYAQVAGPTGPEGAAGATGAVGETGLTGDPGPEGPPGAPGAPGLNGENGAPGLNGVAGENGAPGAAGAEGPPGPAGAEGPPGTFATAQTISSDITAATYTISTSDAGKLLVFNRATTITVTVPTNTSDPIPVGTRIDILQKGTAQVLLYPSGGGGGPSVTIYSSSGLYTRAQYSGATLIKIATDTWSLVGDLTDTAA